MQVPGEPDEALLRASDGAALVVVGRPHRSHGRRSWGHSVARSVLGRTRCPLFVVPGMAGPWLTAVSTSGRWSLGPAVRSS
jgi:nucleotide-binding universal stress UspA family protein